MGFTQFTLGFEGPRWDVDDGAAFLAWRDAQNAARSAAAASRRPRAGRRSRTGTRGALELTLESPGLDARGSRPDRAEWSCSAA